MAIRGRIFPLRIAPGIALFIVLAMLAVQAASALLLYALTPSEIQVYGGRWLADRVADASRDVLLRPRAERGQAVAAVAIDPSITIDLRDSYDSPGGDSPERGRSGWLAGLIRRTLIEPPSPEVGWQVDVAIQPPHRPWFGGPPRTQFVSPSAPSDRRRWDFGVPARFTIAVKGPDGQWLVFTAREPWATLRHVILVAAWLALTALVIGFLSWFAARRVIRPLEAIAGAADNMTSVREPATLPEEGPPELRSIARRLNDMQTRLKRFVDDRTQMIAAISHDLRTPLTRMRLRAEFVEDPVERQKMLDDIGQMEGIVAQTVDFARQDATVEPVVRLDLANLIASICDDLSDAGQSATYSGPASYLVHGQPVALRRALANLLENAVIYGERADVSLETTATEARVVVADNGSGIPQSELETVFRPFYRLEGSRNRATGGTGLGLSIARTILRAHGGDITLENRPKGLIATATLPLRSG